MSDLEDECVAEWLVLENVWRLFLADRPPKRHALVFESPQELCVGRRTAVQSANLNQTVQLSQPVLGSIRMWPTSGRRCSGGCYGHAVGVARGIPPVGSTATVGGGCGDGHTNAL